MERDQDAKISEEWNRRLADIDFSKLDKRYYSRREILAGAGSFLLGAACIGGLLKLIDNELSAPASGSGGYKENTPSSATPEAQQIFPQPEPAPTPLIEETP